MQQTSRGGMEAYKKLIKNQFLKQKFPIFFKEKQRKNAGKVDEKFRESKFKDL